MNYLFNLIPKKLISGLLLIILIIWGLSYGLKFLDLRINEQTRDIQKIQKLELESIKQKINTENSYRDFAHFFALKTLFNQKKSILNEIDKISQILPKSLIVESLNFSNNNKLFTITGKIESVDVFFRIAKYLNDTKNISNLKTAQSFKGNNVLINISGNLTK